MNRFDSLIRWLNITLLFKCQSMHNYRESNNK